ncbi:taurine catabolism dioxygenase TauD, TfdA family-domain-containing protein [Fomitopsis serialis]|uniref:taurine catabolism dioxygenase TauD, TfdA family-domain-containing protein n=1 Tax=Fomitopsis serialis TaxID=139415 RepID=UPI00200854C7|nr:taurine catabolism dioxygenase TauD, TfdA family-domain-containing protein [Neoantrodia serialis]KAH9921815.1 taurine catabolism dioxygenase TauD, TfdA family-domain-containing protein [Neoantrodia serialis]
MSTTVTGRIVTACASFCSGESYHENHEQCRRPLSLVPVTGSKSVHNGSLLPYRWLRDSCQCPSCVHPSTRQKLHRTSDIPADTLPASDGVRVSNGSVEITWASGHVSHYPKTFLELYASPKRLRAFHQEVAAKRWDGVAIRSVSNLFLPYASLQAPAGLLAAITQLARYGVLFVTNVPTARTSNDACELRALAGSFGELRETFYGQTWDVKNVPNSKNIAYTNVDLGLHMDLLYFQHPPRFQILHSLRNRVDGGASYFTLRETHPEDFSVLADTPVAFHYINDGHHLHHSHPTIQLASPQADSTPDTPRPIAHVNYSPPFQAPLPLSTPPVFYPALERFVGLLEDPALRFEYLMREGDAVVFDNRRVLHARTAFKDREGDSGCYLEATQY